MIDTSIFIVQEEDVVDEDDRAIITTALLDRHAVAADLAEAPEEGDGDRFGHEAGQLRPRPASTEKNSADGSIPSYSSSHGPVMKMRPSSRQWIASSPPGRTTLC